MHTIAADKNKTVFGYYIITAGAVLSFIGQQIFPVFFRPTLVYGLLMALVSVVGSIIGIYVLSFVAKKFFKGQGDHEAFFRVVAYGMIVMWIGIIPQLTFIGAIWGLVLLFVILKTVHKLTTNNTIGTLVVAIIIMMAASYLLSPIYSRMGVGGMGGFTTKGGNYMNLDQNNFRMNVPGEDGGSVEFKDGKMKIQTQDGKTVEVNIPTE